MKNYLLFFLTTTLFIAGCKKDDDNDTVPCDDTVTPIVFVHGLLASGDTYANQMMRFTSNNYCGNRMFAFDYNSVNLSGAVDTAALDDFIDDVLQKTAATQVNLVGHSMGGSYGYQYLSDSTRAAKVKYYAHVGSFPDSLPAGHDGNFPMVNIYSTDDEVLEGGDIPGANNVMLQGKDHYEVATCMETFDAIYKFFNNNQAPSTLQITTQSQVQISGKVLTLGENSPKPNSTVQVFEVNSLTGERLSSSPAFTLNINSKGEWGPNDVTPGKFYEFEVNTNEGGDRIIHYYREGFKHTNPLVYLRTLPPPTSTAGILLSSLPKDDNQSVVILFTANQATIEGRDSLTVVGSVLSTPTFCAAANTTIAFFLYDDGDNQTELTQVPSFSAIPFLEAGDMFFQTVTPQSIQCRFNGRNLFVRNWKSDTEGVAIAVFD